MPSSKKFESLFCPGSGAGRAKKAKMNANNVKDIVTLLETSNKAGWVVYLYEPTFAGGFFHDGTTYLATLKLGDPHEGGNGHGCVVINTHTQEVFNLLCSLCQVEFGQGDAYDKKICFNG